MTPVGQAGFAATHWSLVLNAGGGDSPQANAALERFCAVYWFPLYAHIRRRGHKPEDARDLTQGSFASLFRRDSLSRVGPEKGRFRTFLLTSLYDFLADQADHRNAARRGSGSPPIELDALQTEDRYALELASGETPDKSFDRRWVCALMERALVRLEHEQTAADKVDHFTRLKPFLEREPDQRLGGHCGRIGQCHRRHGAPAPSSPAGSGAGGSNRYAGNPAEAEAELRALLR